MVNNRATLVIELEEIFRKRVFAIVYNRDSEEGIKDGDEKYFKHFIEEIIKKENVRDCVLILNGPGGNLKTSILCSQLLRDNLQRYDSFVPTVVGSSLCYFVLQSDRLLIGEKSILTQMDPLFYYEGEYLRAIKHINNQNLNKSSEARKVFGPVFDNLGRIIKTRPNVFEKEVSVISNKKNYYLQKLIESWMGKDFHESGIKKDDLRNLKVNFKTQSQEIVSKATELINTCAEELAREDARFAIQTNKIEGNYYGGYFHS